MTQLPVPVITIGLLLASNIFMTFAWYGHLSYKSTAIGLAILVVVFRERRSINVEDLDTMRG